MAVLGGIWVIKLANGSDERDSACVTFIYIDNVKMAEMSSLLLMKTPGLRPVMSDLYTVCCGCVFK